MFIVLKLQIKDKTAVIGPAGYLGGAASLSQKDIWSVTSYPSIARLVFSSLELALWDEGPEFYHSAAGRFFGISSSKKPCSILSVCFSASF